MNGDQHDLSQHLDSIYDQLEVPTSDRASEPSLTTILHLAERVCVSQESVLVAAKTADQFRGSMRLLRRARNLREAADAGLALNRSELRILENLPRLVEEVTERLRNTSLITKYREDTFRALGAMMSEITILEARELSEQKLTEEQLEFLSYVSTIEQFFDRFAPDHQAPSYSQHHKPVIGERK